MRKTCDREYSVGALQDVDHMQADHSTLFRSALTTPYGLYAKRKTHIIFQSDYYPPFMSL